MNNEIEVLMLTLVKSYEEQTKVLKVIEERLTKIESEITTSKKITPSLPQTQSLPLQNTKAFNHLSNLGIAGGFTEFGL